MLGRNMKYEEIVKTICGEAWQVNQVERDGGYGVACLLAFMKGSKPTVDAIATHLGVSIDEIQLPYSRLIRAGVFSNEFNAREDSWLLGKESNCRSLCAYLT